ncbi:MAG: M3 family metallopeptidase, partial [Myxococcota bacterium]
PLAYLYLDLYARPNKMGGAWQTSHRSRSRVMAQAGESVQLPTAIVVCNQAPPLEGQPALMDIREVQTLFHEFGHALHHMLTVIDEGFCSGTSGVEWDAIEVPSTFLEHWCTHRETLRGLTAHAETGETIPDALLDQVMASWTHMAGYNLMRQLYLSVIDLELHHRTVIPDGPETIAEVDARIEAQWTLLSSPTDSCFMNQFSHIFAGGYAAGYYSYKWAEVMSTDIFAAFHEAGIDDAEAISQVGRRLRETLFAQGGGRDPMLLFTDFRERAPRIEPLLQRLGLAA